jgi:hypothetical protein
MKNKFKLTNLVLYAKGWYLKTDNIWEDLKKILVLDDYSPFTNNDVYSIISSNFQECNLYRWTELKEVLNGIHPNNCWKYGYYTKENVFWSGGKTVAELPDYDMPTAFIYYVLSSLNYMDRNDWNVSLPKYLKYPKSKNITINMIYKQFVKPI